MGFRHIVLLTLGDGCDLERLVTDLRALPASVPTIRTYVVGVDLGISDGNATIGVVGDFDDRAGWEAYRDDPEHQRIIIEQIRPHLLGRSAVQHDT
jgi:hypothetical protein